MEMFLTKAELTPRALGKLGIISRYDVHRFVHSLFGNRERDFLFSIDMFGRTGAVITILSPEKPAELDSADACRPAAHALKPDEWKMRTVRMTERFFEKDAYILAMRISCRERKTSSDPKANPHGTQSSAMSPEAIMGWFRKREERLGFRIMEGSLGIMEAGCVNTSRYGRGAKRVSIPYADIICRIEVTDREALMKAFSEGIGAGRAFGLGLMGIMPAETGIKED